MNHLCLGINKSDKYVKSFYIIILGVNMSVTVLIVLMIKLFLICKDDPRVICCGLKVHVKNYNGKNW